MFDIGGFELLLCAMVAIIVIGPKDLPAALRVAGRWVAKGRSMTRQLRAGFDAMVHEAELEEMERKWSEQNARIMREHADAPAMLPMEGGDTTVVEGKAQDKTATPDPGPPDVPEHNESAANSPQSGLP